jgi:hypothetical protein
MSDPNEQQWEKVTIRHNQTSRDWRKERGPARIESSVRASQSIGEHLAKVERDADEGALKTKKVTTESKNALVKARLEFARGKLTQDQADAECALPRHTIRDIEAGRLVPGPDMLRKISRGLRVDLKLE